MAEDSDNLLPFLVGGLVGCAVALLLAPKTGEEFRKDVRSWLERGRQGRMLETVRSDSDAFRGRRNGHRRSSKAES